MTYQVGDMARIKMDNLNRVADVRGEPVEIIASYNDGVRVRILGNTMWGRMKHECFMDLCELEQVIMKPQWEV